MMKILITALLICISFSLNAQITFYVAAICDDEKIDRACCYADSLQAPVWLRNSDPRRSDRINNFMDIVITCGQIQSYKTEDSCTIAGTPEFIGYPESRVPLDCVVKEFE